MEPTTLSLKGISTVVQSTNTHVILQVLNLQQDMKEVADGGKAFVSEISDGFAKLRCYWSSNLFDKILAVKKHFSGAIVRLTEYSASAKKVLVHSFDMVYLFDETIGDPVSYKDYLANKLSDKAKNIIDLEKVVKYQEATEEVTKPLKVLQTPKNQNIRANANTPLTLERIKVKDASHYETIDQLYTGMDNWILFCRVNKCNFREFSNKKGGKTQLLQFELRDKNDWTIKCTIFGEHAVKMSKTIYEGQVYTFAQGSIKVDTYKTPAHDKDSPYSIIFTQHSKINLATNDDSIKEKQNSFQTISNIKDWKINGEIDVACIIKQIQPQSVYVNKTNNETHPKRTIIVCDPINKIETQVTFWRNSVSLVDESLLNKTVALESFKVNQYKGKLSLTAGLKSKMYELRGHQLNKFESSVVSSQFESISFQKGESGEQKDNISSIKKLLEQCENLRGKDTIWSTFRVFLNRSKEKGKKWYSGCPLGNCKKSVEDLDIKCPHCGKAFDKPAYRYILGIQVSDCIGSGSLWTTAYDEFCRKILSLDQDLPADKARNMSEDQFNDTIKRCMFQQFKITMSSKAEQSHDFTRRVKHQISSYTIVDHAKEAKINLEKIRTLML